MDFPKGFISSKFSERGSLILTEKASLIQTDHDKFIVVIKKFDDRIIYCVVNSDRYARNPGSQLAISITDQPEITPSDNSYLSHNSYVNCANVQEYPLDEFKKKIDEKVFIPKGALSDAAMQRVLEAGRQSKVLRKFQKEYFQ